MTKDLPLASPDTTCDLCHKPCRNLHWAILKDDPELDYSGVTDPYVLQVQSETYAIHST